MALAFDLAATVETSEEAATGTAEAAAERSDEQRDDGHDDEDEPPGEEAGPVVAADADHAALGVGAALPAVDLVRLVAQSVLDLVPEVAVVIELLRGRN